MIAAIRPALLALGLIVLIALPLFAGKYGLDLAARIMIMAIFALSLDLLVGYAGMVSLGHAAFFGIGAYALYLLSPEYGAANLLLSLPAAVARRCRRGAGHRPAGAALLRRLFHHGDAGIR